MSATTQRTDEFESDELLALARIDIERNALDEALRKLKQIINQSDAPAEAFSMAGRLYAQLGLWEKAKTQYQRYLKQQPSAITETFQLGMVHFDAGQKDEAKHTWDTLLEKSSLYPPALFYRALAYAEDGQNQEARLMLDVLMKSVPADNLYFSRAKELMRTLEAGTPQSESDNSGAKPTSRARAKDPYQTEH